MNTLRFWRWYSVPFCAVLGDEILQRRLAADDGEDHLADRVVRGAQGRLGDLAQQRLLAGDALEVLDELGDDLLLGARVDPMHRRDQQLREASVTSRSRSVQQGAEQRELRRRRMLAQMNRRLDRRAGSPPSDDPRVDTVEQAGGQADRADRFEL